MSVRRRNEKYGALLNAIVVREVDADGNPFDCKIEHLMLIDGVFEATSDRPIHSEPVSSAPCLCGYECDPRSREVGWISLIPSDEDYIGNHSVTSGERSPTCIPCVDSATTMKTMIALGGQ